MGNDRLKDIGEKYLNEWLDFRHPSKKVLDPQTGNVIEKPVGEI